MSILYSAPKDGGGGGARDGEGRASTIMIPPRVSTIHVCVWNRGKKRWLAEIISFTGMGYALPCILPAP